MSGLGFIGRLNLLDRLVQLYEYQTPVVGEDGVFLESASSVSVRIIGVLASIYLFLMGLDMMGSSFLVLGGKGAGSGARCLGKSPISPYRTSPEYTRALQRGCHKH